MQSKKHLLACLLFTIILLNACSTHRLEISQGHTLKASSIDQLHTGMTEQQVKQLLGTPSITDPFHRGRRWDYIDQTTQKNITDRRMHLILYFEQGILQRIQKNH